MFGLNRAFRLTLQADSGGGDGGAQPAGGAAPDAAGSKGDAGGQQQPGGAGAAGSGATTESVPYDRFKAVNDQAKAATDRVAQLEQEIKNYQRQGQTEEQRREAELADERAAREAAEKRASDLEAAQQLAERNGWIRDAATAAKFHDPSDAIARLSGEDIKTPAAAERAVKALAEKSAHLVQQEAPQGDAAAQLQKVLNGGKPADGKTDGDVIPESTLATMTVDQLVELQTTKPELYARSIAAAART